MTDQDQNQLLEHLLGDDDLNQLRQASLSRGLKEMRRRRRHALAARVSLMAFPVLLLAMMAFFPRIHPPYHAPAPITMAFDSRSEPKVEYITADQLFALFPNRQMALVGKPGHQQFLFLDDHPASDNQ